MIEFLLRKWNLSIRLPSEIKNFPIDQAFSKWVIFIKMLQSKIDCEIQRALQSYIFSLKFQSQLFFVSLRSLLFSNCQFAMI